MKLIRKLKKIRKDLKQPKIKRGPANQKTHSKTKRANHKDTLFKTSAQLISAFSY